MVKGSLLTRYDSAGNQVLAASIRLVGVDDLNVRASCSDRTFVPASELDGLTFGIEKPGLFTLDFKVKERVPRFSFTGGGRILGRDLRLAYNHIPLTRDALITEATLAANPANLVAGKLVFPRPKGQLKLSMVHRGATTIEPALELPGRAWNLAVSHRLPGNHCVRASYDHGLQTVGLGWSREPEGAGACRISATVPVKEPKNVHVIMEKTWNFSF